VILNTKQKSEFIASNKLQNKNVFESSLGIYDVYKLYTKPNLLRDTQKSILFFGRISPYKGIHILLAAMKSLHQIHPEVKLIIAGSGEYYFDKTEFEQLDYIDFRNRYIPNEELVRLIQDSMFIVCPYTDATQSGVIMTSYAFCKPVVASDVGGLAEMVLDKVTGNLVEPNNCIDLKNTIISLISNQKLLEAMERNIKTHFYSGNKGWKQISKNLFSVYEIVRKK
jgi:glycosyltransferase involved in cell wall biosynthesis